MTNKEIDEMTYRLQEEMLMNFFAGNHSIVFDNKREVKEFFKFIKRYDNRYNENFDKLEDVKEAAWLFDPTRHNYQLEWVSVAEHEQFLKHYFNFQYGRFSDFSPIKYSEIAKYIRVCIDAHKTIDEMQLYADRIDMPLESVVSRVFTGNENTIDEIKDAINKSFNLVATEE